MEQRDDYRGNYFLLLVSKNQTFLTKIFLVKPWKTIPCLAFLSHQSGLFTGVSAAFDR